MSFLDVSPCDDLTVGEREQGEEKSWKDATLLRREKRKVLEEKECKRHV